MKQPPVKLNYATPEPPPKPISGSQRLSLLFAVMGTVLLLLVIEPEETRIFSVTACGLGLLGACFAIADPLRRHRLSGLMMWNFAVVIMAAIAFWFLS